MAKQRFTQPQAAADFGMRVELGAVPAGIATAPTPAATKAAGTIFQLHAQDEWSDADLAARIAEIGDPNAHAQMMSEAWVERRKVFEASKKAEERAIGELFSESRLAMKRAGILGDEKAAAEKELARRLAAKAAEAASGAPAAV